MNKPLVILVPGVGGDKAKMAPLAEILKDEYNVLSFSCKPFEVKEIDKCILDRQAHIRSIINENKSDIIGLVGFSAGGSAVLSYIEKNIGAIVALAPYYPRKLGQLASKPTLIMTGERDKMAPPKMGKRFFDELSKPKVYLSLKDVPHENAVYGKPQIAGYIKIWLDVYLRNLSPEIISNFKTDSKVKDSAVSLA